MSPSFSADSMPPMPAPTTRTSCSATSADLRRDAPILEPGQCIGELGDVLGEWLGADRADGRELQSLRSKARLVGHSLRPGGDARRSLRAIGQVGALVAVRGEEHAVEATPDGVNDPRWPDAP